VPREDVGPTLSPGVRCGMWTSLAIVPALFAAGVLTLRAEQAGRRLAWHDAGVLGIIGYVAGLGVWLVMIAIGIHLLRRRLVRDASSERIDLA